MAPKNTTTRARATARPFTTTTTAADPAADTTSYILRDVDAELWTRFRARAGARGSRSVLLGLIAAYAEGALDVEQQTTTTTQVVARARR